LYWITDESFCWFWLELFLTSSCICHTVVNVIKYTLWMMKLLYYQTTTSQRHSVLHYVLSSGTTTKIDISHNSAAR
jgi:hypothetical protein